MTQTNYNERLDALALRWWNGDYDKSFDELSAVIKTEITQLFKDLVTDAKPWDYDAPFAGARHQAVLEYEQNILELLEAK